MNNPSIQFYPGDWLRDHVSGCSLAAQGLWLRMLILMHDCERYGYLSMNGSPIPSEFIARKCGCDTLSQYETLLAELTAAGVPSRTSTGIIYSRRMVKDANERQQTKARVQKFRAKSREEKQADNPESNDECNTNCNADVTQMKQRSSSSSSSSSSKTNTNVFVVPTLDEVKILFTEKTGISDPLAHNFATQFIGFYSSNGWKVGKNKMKDWKIAACNTWMAGERWAPLIEEAKKSKLNGKSSRQTLEDIYR